jgi:hypothetical protein
MSKRVPLHKHWHHMIRADFPDMINPIPTNDLDAYMLSTNNRGNNAYRWRQLAGFVAKYFHMREQHMSRED